MFSVLDMTDLCILHERVSHTPPIRAAKLSLVSLSSDVFKRRASTGSGRFALLSRDFDQIFGQIVSIRIKTLDNKIW